MMTNMGLIFFSQMQISVHLQVTLVPEVSPAYVTKEGGLDPAFVLLVSPKISLMFVGPAAVGTNGRLKTS